MVCLCPCPLTGLEDRDALILLPGFSRCGCLGNAYRTQRKKISKCPETRHRGRSIVWFCDLCRFPSLKGPALCAFLLTMHSKPPGHGPGGACRGAPDCDIFKIGAVPSQVRAGQGVSILLMNRPDIMLDTNRHCSSIQSFVASTLRLPQRTKG